MSDNDPIIHYIDVLPFLAAACPTFAGSTQAKAADPEDGEFLLVGHFVSHLIDLLQIGHTDSFIAVFGVVEWILAEGDDEARSLIIHGFLDDLVTPALYLETTKFPKYFEYWLGPQARQHRPADPDLSSRSSSGLINTRRAAPYRRPAG